MPIDPKSIKWDAPEPSGIVWDDAPAKSTKKLSALEKITTGASDPIHGGAQLLTKLLPSSVVDAGNAANNWLADKTGLVARVPAGGVDQMVKSREADYQARRAADGESGFDGLRLLGNVLSPASVGTGMAGAALGSGIKAAALGGAVSGAMTPATSDDFAKEKMQQIGLGAAGGAAAPAVASGLSRIVSPKASTNPLLQTLRNEGVNPTVGQALGGSWNKAEEKLSSLPLAGDMISRARRGAVEDFNNAAINRATGKVGAKVEGSGFDAVANAGREVGKAYDDALGSVSHIQFDGQFAQDFSQLRGMARNLVPEMRKKFDQVARDIVGGRMSPANAMLPDTFKKVDSELGKNAARYSSSSTASEQELGDALKQLQSLVRQQASRSDPTFAGKLQAADEAYSNLVRVEGAAKAAKNSEGVFSPAQLNQAIQTADKSVRKRAVSQGNALMQDLGNAGQSVLGNKVPDSGTAGRVANLGALGSGLYNPLIPIGLAAGGVAYTSPVQRMLVNAIASRPQSAKAIAEALKKNALAVSPASGLAFIEAAK